MKNFPKILQRLATDPGSLFCPVVNPITEIKSSSDLIYNYFSKFEEKE